MKLTYVGVHDEVAVALPLGGEARVKRGQSLSTSEEHGRSLLMQPSNWAEEAPRAAKATLAAKAEPKADEAEPDEGSDDTPETKETD